VRGPALTEILRGEAEARPMPDDIYWWLVAVFREADSQITELRDEIAKIKEAPMNQD